MEELIDAPHSQRVKFFFIISQELSMIFQTYETIRAREQVFESEKCSSEDEEKKNFYFFKKAKVKPRVYDVKNKQHLNNNVSVQRVRNMKISIFFLCFFNERQAK